MAEQGFDYIIVGGGAAGCVLASRLSENPAVRVLMLEAGGKDDHPLIHMPVGFAKMTSGPYTWGLTTVPQRHANDRSLIYAQGRVLGGGSSINAEVFTRGHPSDYDRWVEEANAPGWGFDDVKPLFIRSEGNTMLSGDWHGTDGPLGVSNIPDPQPMTRAFVQSCQEYGIPFNADFNGETTKGVGFYQLSIGRRLRASAAARFLRPALKRGNVDLLTRAHVTRVAVENGRAVGVEVSVGGEVRTIRASREVILSAGAIQSPQILELSGIGAADRLRRLGIECIVDSPGVGENLQDHYQMRLIVRLKRKLSLNDDVRNPVKLAQMGLEWLVLGKGPLTVGAGQIGGAAATSHAFGDRPDVQFNVMPLSVDKPGTPLHRYSGFTASVWQCHPESRGSIHVASADPFASPQVAPRYFERDIDRKTILEGVRIVRQINRQPSFHGLWDEEIIPGGSARSDEEIWNAVRTMGGTVFHAVGTCRMGADSGSVVDPALRVRGV